LIVVRGNRERCFRLYRWCDDKIGVEINDKDLRIDTYRSCAWAPGFPLSRE